jgi:superfamily II DNA or RNA helicase
VPIFSTIFRRVHYGIVKAVAPVSPARNAGVEVPHFAAPTLNFLESSEYRLSSVPSGTIGLLSDAAKCKNIIPHLLPKPRSQIISLLPVPTTQDHLQWQPTRLGAINPNQYCFLLVHHRHFPLLECPENVSYPMEIQRADNFVSNIEFRPFALPKVADCLNQLELAVQISGNLFKPLGRVRADGKSYRKADGFKLTQTTLQLPQQAEPEDRGYRKSYRERKNSDGTHSRQPMSIWDLLFPLLQPPPFDLTTEEQVFLPAELLPHQPEGVRFLASREAALLGDGVQTGKTIQTIVAIKLLFQTGKIDSALIVCPIPLLIHWQKELEKWSPELGLTVVRSTNKDERRTRWRMPAHVYATNYENIVNDFDDIVAIRGAKGFGLIVADEIQRIKHAGTATAQKLKQLVGHAPTPGFLRTADDKLTKSSTCKYRWGLSATPIENSVEDLVSIFEFLKPGLLRREFENEETAKRKIQSYFLRRRTADVVKHFKEPHHQPVDVEMEGRQLEAYEQAFRESVAELKRLGERVTLTHALAKLQALKQLCNVHLPSGESAKLEWLLDQLEQIKANGDKVLLFTQYIASGRDFLAERLAKIGCLNYGRATTDTQRRACIETFLADASKPVFLANPKVAGVGLPDLKVANYVIHFDHWWNPAVEDQANGRILGIGQKKDAFIVHLWVENSIEGRIQAILSRKRDLFGRVIDSQSNVDGTGLTEDELFELFGLQVPPKKQAPAKTSTAHASESRTNLGVSRPVLKEQQAAYSPTITPQQLSPADFEDLVARIYSKIGFSVRRTQQTRDGGIDVIAIRDHPTGRDKLAIQCKRQENPVGRPELQKLLGVISADPSFSAGVLVTTSTFSTDARHFAEMNGRLKLVDRNLLAQLLVQYRVPVRE